jgi:hypothetical protein
MTVLKNQPPMFLFGDQRKNLGRSKEPVHERVARTYAKVPTWTAGWSTPLLALSKPSTVQVTTLRIPLQQCTTVGS